jgi:hypothetical protein
MTHERITRLRIAPGCGWAAACESLARRVASIRADADLRVVRIDDERALLIASASDREALERIDRDVVAPWIAELDLAEPSSSDVGEIAWACERTDPFAEIDALGDVERVEHFVRRVVESGGAWGLYDKTWARSNAAPGREALPLWPDRELAARCIAGPWRTFTPRAIDLPMLREQWLTGMQEDGIVAVVTPTPRDPGVVVEPGVIADALALAL